MTRGCPGSPRATTGRLQATVVREGRYKDTWLGKDKDEDSISRPEIKKKDPKLHKCLTQ